MSWWKHNTRQAYPVVPSKQRNIDLTIKSSVGGMGLYLNTLGNCDQS